MYLVKSGVLSGDLRLFVADLHIHSVLSPCAQREMLPQCIILEALEKKIDIIALCDHNACDNVEVAVSLGARFGVWVIPGIEVETKEEIHLLGYFPTVTMLSRFTQELQRFLPRLPLREEIWGEEWVVNEEGTIVEKKDHLLVCPIHLTLEETHALVVSHGGIPVPAHVDRKSYSLFSQLGFIPPQLAIKVVEISPATSREEVLHRGFSPALQYLCSSDAHSLEEIGQGVTHFAMRGMGWREFILALYGRDGRKIVHR